MKLKYFKDIMCPHWIFSHLLCSWKLQIEFKQCELLFEDESHGNEGSGNWNNVCVPHIIWTTEGVTLCLTWILWCIIFWQSVVLNMDLFFHKCFKSHREGLGSFMLYLGLASDELLNLLQLTLCVLVYFNQMKCKMGMYWQWKWAHNGMQVGGGRGL